MLNKILLLLNVFFFIIIPVVAEDIKIGLLFDMSGQTKDVCVPYAQGVTDFFSYINSQGGIKGNKIIPLIRDTQYNADKAAAEYELMKKENVKLIHGWGTEESLKIQPLVSADKMIFISGSYDDPLGDAKKWPYNFFIGASYSMQASAALDFIKEDAKGRKPVVGILTSSTAFGKAAFTSVFHAKAKRMGFKIVEDIVELNAKEANKQLKKMIDEKVEYIIIQETLGAAIAILHSSNANKYAGKLIGLNWAVNESIVSALGKGSEGYLGFPLFSQWEEISPGMKKLQDYVKKKTGSSIKKPSKYISGWTTAQIIFYALSQSKDFSSDSIKSAFESIKKYDAEGLSPPVSFSSRDHRGQESCKIYEIKLGVLQPHSNKFYNVKK